MIFSHYGAGRWIPGGFGVTLFFFISGYLITSLLCGELRQNGHLNVAGFYIRRFRRLAPAILFMIATVSSVFALRFGAAPPPEIAAGALYYMNYYQISYSITVLPLGPLWSLAVEEHFYLVFPLAVIVFYNAGKKFLVGLLAACAVVLLWRFYLFQSRASDFRIFAGTDTRIDSILFGCALAVALVCLWRSSLNHYGSPRRSLAFRGSPKHPWHVS